MDDFLIPLAVVRSPAIYLLCGPPSSSFVINLKSAKGLGIEIPLKPLPRVGTSSP